MSFEILSNGDKHSSHLILCLGGDANHKTISLPISDIIPFLVIELIVSDLLLAVGEFLALVSVRLLGALPLLFSSLFGCLSLSFAEAVGGWTVMRSTNGVLGGESRGVCWSISSAHDE